MMNLKTIGCLALAVVAAGSFAPQAQAQEAPSFPAAMNRAFFNESGDIYRNANIDRQFTLLFGLSFPDKEILGDTQSINAVVKEGIRQRINTPIITQDLPNPYASSLLSNPGATQN
jgi:hypothetical protein